MLQFLQFTPTSITTLIGVEDARFDRNPARPRYETLQALERIFTVACCLVREEPPAYITRQQGNYTLEDYYALPDDERAELIDGVLYDMASPSTTHQLIAGFLHAKFLSHVMSQGAACLPMIAPLDIQLDCDDKTMVQPDVIVVCDRCKVIDRCVYGAPDFVIEVLSKSTKKKDSVIKLNKYMNAGVQEYWLIDPIKQKIIVYDFAHNEYPIIYGFDAKVPVHIWDAAFSIDFQEVYEHIRFLYERGYIEQEGP